MPDDQQALFDAVREACFPRTWSRGVELTRADAVVGEELGAEETTFRVTTRGGMICPRVTLFVEDHDWECECSSRETVCEHVAAAVIAWRQAAREGKELPTPKLASGRVGYRFSRTPAGLGLERVIVHGDEELPLDATLAAVAAGKVSGPRFLATNADLNAELELGTHRRGLLPRAQMSRVFRSLSRCGDVTLDGGKVAVSTEPIVPGIRVEDHDGGFRVALEPPVAAGERFANGAVLRDGTLHLVGEPKLTAREREDLTRGLVFAPEEVAELVASVLPGLAGKAPLDIRTDRLPETVRERPRIAIDVDRDGHTLSVLATLVYGDPPMARIDGTRLVHLQGPVPDRDERAERIELQRLRRLGLAPGVRARFTGVEAVAFGSRLAEWSEDVRGDALAHFEVTAPIVPRLEMGGGRFDVVFESEPERGSPGGRGGRADPADVLRAWREGASLVPLMEGGWAPLPSDWLARYGHRIADLLAARGEDGTLPRCTLPDLAALCEELDEPAPPELAGLSELARNFEGLPGAPLPEDLTATLRPYQRRGVDWLVFLREARLGALLADDMGLGKTLQALCAIEPPALVVAPTSVLHNWEGEIRRHRPGLTYSVYHGPKREIDPAADVTLTTYAILRLDSEKLSRRAWTSVVLDEAQNIKNPESRVAAAAFGLDAGFRVALTGTPVENRLDELWSQFHFVNRGLLGGRTDFRERYADPIARGEDGAAPRLRERIRPFLLRRLKSEVAKDLPPRTDMVLECELDPDERETYDAIRAATLRDVVRKLDAGGNVLAALEALLRLRQAACHRGLVPGQEASGSSKLRLLLETLDSVVAEGRKALVFSQWTSFLDLTEPHLREAGITYLRLDGSTRDRGEVVRAFQEEPEISVLVISLKAGGTGLNLTAADHIFLLDPWWNPAVEDQAADRAHRIGQENPVMVYRLVALETVEERILALQEAKRRLADAALGEADRAAGLTRQDLLDLLG